MILVRKSQLRHVEKLPRPRQCSVRCEYTLQALLTYFVALCRALFGTLMVGISGEVNSYEACF